MLRCHTMLFSKLMFRQAAPSCHTMLFSKLMSTAAKLVAPGGLLIFATCSLQPEEGIDHVAPFLDSHTAFQLEPIVAEEVYGLSETLTPCGCFRSLPCHLSDSGGMDGFFAARFRRQNV